VEDVKSEASLLDAARQLLAAERQGDVASIERLLAADYRGYDPAGRQQDRAGVLRAYADGGVRLTNVQLNGLQARIIGETGLVTGISSVQGSQGDEHFDFRLRFLDVYAWRDDRWELVASQNTRLAW
jgi:ketosteroid isomerase-like protein